MNRDIWKNILSYVNIMQRQANSYVYCMFRDFLIRCSFELSLDSELNYVIGTVFSILFFMIHVESVFRCEYINFLYNCSDYVHVHCVLSIFFMFQFSLTVKLNDLLLILWFILHKWQKMHIPKICNSLWSSSSKHIFMCVIISCICKHLTNYKLSNVEE